MNQTVLLIAYNIPGARGQSPRFGLAQAKSRDDLGNQSAVQPPSTRCEIPVTSALASDAK